MHVSSRDSSLSCKFMCRSKALGVKPLFYKGLMWLKITSILHRLSAPPNCNYHKVHYTGGSQVLLNAARERRVETRKFQLWLCKVIRKLIFSANTGKHLSSCVCVVSQYMRDILNRYYSLKVYFLESLLNLQQYYFLV